MISLTSILVLTILSRNDEVCAYKTSLNNNPIPKHPEIFVGAAAYTRAGSSDQQVTNEPSRSPPKPISKSSQPSHKLEPKPPANININNNSKNNNNNNKPTQSDRGASDTKRDAAESATNARINDDTCLVRITINDDWLYYARFRLMSAIKRLVSIIGTGIQRRKQHHHRIRKRDTKCLWNSNPEASSWSLDVIAKKPKFQPFEQQSQQHFREQNFPPQINEIIWGIVQVN